MAGLKRCARCTCLAAASYCPSFLLYFAYSFGVSLHARGCVAVGCAAQAALPAEVPDSHGGAAHEQFFDRFGLTIVRGRVQRRCPARQTGGDSAGALTAEAETEGRTRSGLGR